MEQLISSTTSLSSDQVPTTDLETAPAMATVAQPANIPSLENEKELENKDIESDVGSWLCVFASLLFLTSSYGFMNSLGTIQSYLTHNELSDYTVSQVGWISGTYLFLSLIFNFQIGAILDRYGPQILSPIAAAFSTVTFLLLAECKEYWHFILCLGLFGSIGSSIGAVTAIGVVGKLFTRRRGLAMGLAVMGTSLGGIIYPMMLRATFGKLGWAWSMRLVALVIACLTSLGVLCFLPFRRLTEGRPNVQQPQGLGLDLSAFKSLKFVITAFGICMVEFVNYGISGLLPTIATGAGFSIEDGYTLLSILGACSCLGRFSIGFVGDKVGPFNAVVSTMLVIVILLSTIFIPFSTTSAPLMYVFTALWGYCSGSFYVLSPLCTGKTLSRNGVLQCQGGSPCEYCIRTKKTCEPQIIQHDEAKFVSWTTSPQPLQMTKLPVQINEQFEGTYLGYFNLFMQRCQFTKEFVNFGANILPLIHTCPPLREATIAIGALEASRRATVNSSHERKSPKQIAFGSYGRSIRQLQSWLQSADTASCQGSLWCTLLLTLFELTTQISGDQWADHLVYGTSRMLQSSITLNHRNQLDRQLVGAFRLLEANRAVLYGVETFISQDAWLNHYSRYALDPSSPVETIFGLLIEISSFTQKFFDRAESLPETIQPDHPDICALAAQGFIMLRRLEDWYESTIPQIQSSDAYLKLGLANYHALHLFIYQNYTYYAFWDRSEIPILAEDEARPRVAAIIALSAEVINSSDIPGILTLFALRVAGVTAREISERRAILVLLDQIAQKGFVVSRRISDDLKGLWEYESSNEYLKGFSNLNFEPVPLIAIILIC
ncbi:hypothetical protein HG530_013127 [Fusarium avenaceum]|nr:hypothetical protein HG530_013127 [Fusarium avenaceum]